MGIREKAVRAVTREQADGWGGMLQKSLIPLSLLYRGGTAIRSSLYGYGLLASRRLTRPVISVGNMVAGGTGKTPLVIKIVEHLASQGTRCAVLSRGYKGKAGQAVNIVSDRDQIFLSPEEAGDEPCLIAQKLPGTPVLVGKDRYVLGSEAIRRFDPDCLILDDGYQHLSLRRECNLLLLDSDAPFGNGWCLPAGTLREGLSAIKRAGLIALTGDPGDEVVAVIKSIAKDTPLHSLKFTPGGIRRLPMGRPEDQAGLDGKRIMAFAGIARPERFFRSIERLGAHIMERRIFPDHHPYRREEIVTLCRVGAEKKVDMLLTTEKDAVRLPEIPESLPLFALQLSIEIPDQERFFGDIRRLIGK